ncbi:hypothetical protein LCGC14_2059910 [marine sediment metagenome]|uniref:Uncharacterized protein n=1 Tax=marine sediment metagenome TaxID=412755 RepID=A0A0F9F8X5_9ZZZZ
MKRKKKPLYKTIRKVWGFNPKTRCKGNDKVYNRKREKEEFRKELEDEY